MSRRGGFSRGGGSRIGGSPFGGRRPGGINFRTRSPIRGPVYHRPYRPYGYRGGYNPCGNLVCFCFVLPIFAIVFISLFFSGFGSAFYAPNMIVMIFPIIIITLIIFGVIASLKKHQQEEMQNNPQEGPYPENNQQPYYPNQQYQQPYQPNQNPTNEPQYRYEQGPYSRQQSQNPENNQPTKFCSYCGSKNKYHDKFCMNCGANISN